ncbi:yjcC family transcription regulator [Clostridium sp. CAG:628]|jgi:TPP-dependent pyruvate/acetoin dehydrogenase alpha subunit|nr:yjcC family transcription regulator [Clostridium sp. CAG:628]
MGKEDLFERIEKKTNVSKDTIIRLAKELQEGDIKNENTLRNIIGEISELTGKEVSKEKEDKIVNMVISDKVPKDIEKYV